MTFWIGDWVRSKLSGKVGVYEGEKNFKARVKIKEKYYLISDQHLVKLSDDEVEEERIKSMFSSKKMKIAPPKHKGFNETLDLHIEVLAPSLKGKRAEHILLKQLRAARDFIQDAIDRNQFRIVLIHGKGSGVLKMEIEHLLMEFDEVFFTKEVNNGGALEVLFKY